MFDATGGGCGSAAIAGRPEQTRAYDAEVSELSDHLAQVRDIAERARTFRGSEASDPKAFSRAVVTDLGVLAEAVAELIERTESGPALLGTSQA